MTRRGLILGIAGLAAASGGAQAQILSWDGDCDDLWDGTCGIGTTETNWNPEDVPDNMTTCIAQGDHIRVFGTGRQALTLTTTGGSFTILNNADLTLTGGGMIANASIQGALIASGQTTFSGTSTLGGGGRLVGAGPFCATDTFGISGGSVGFGANPMPPVTLTSKGSLTLSSSVNIAPGCLLVNEGEARSVAATGITGQKLRNEGSYSIIATSVNVTAEYEQTDGVTAVTGGTFSCDSANADLRGGRMTAAMDGVIRLRLVVGGGPGHVIDGLESVSGEGHFLVLSSATVGSPVEISMNPLATAVNRGFEVGGGVVLTMNADLDTQGVSRFAGATSGGGTFKNSGDMHLLQALFSSPFVNDGMLSQLSASQQEVQLGAGGSITNNSTWTHTSGVLRRSAGMGWFLNTGDFERPDSATSTLELRVPFDQDGGSITLEGGDVEVYASGTWMNGSTMDVGSGVEVRSRTGTWTFQGAGHEISGAGLVTLGNWFEPMSYVVEDGAELELSVGAGLILGSAFRMDNRASITGGGTVRNTGWVEWRAGRVGSAAGRTRFENEGRLAIIAGPAGTQVLGGDLLNVSGIAGSGGVGQTVRLNVEAGSSILNEGDWSMFDGADLIGPASVVLTNTGDLTAIGPSDGYIIQPTLDNLGDVTAESGATLNLAGPVAQLVGGVLLGGDWITLTGGRILFPGDITTIGASARVAGDSTSIPALGSLQRVEGQLFVEGALDLDGSLEALGGASVRMVRGGLLVAPKGVLNGLPLFESPSDLWATPPSNPFEDESPGRGGEPSPHVVTPLFENHAVIAPGDLGHAGPFVLEGELVLYETSTLDIDLGGQIAPDEHDQLVVTGPATLGGTLWVHLLDGYEPAPDAEFVVLTASQIGGAFDDVASPAVGGRRLRAQYAPTSVTLVQACAADLAEPLGTLDFSDVLAFITAFGAEAPDADMAEPLGVFNFSDVLAFLVAYGAGCP